MWRCLQQHSPWWISRQSLGAGDDAGSLIQGSLQHTIGFSDIQHLFIFILADVGWISRFLWLNVKSSESLGSFIFFHL